MAYVTITKDLTEVKDKVAFGLTKRQIVCFSLGGIAGVGTYFLTRHSLGNDLALLLLIALAAPFMLFGLYEKNGQPLEKILKNIIRVRLLAPAARPYQTNNRFAALERQARYEKEVQQLVSIQNKATGKNSRLVAIDLKIDDFKPEYLGKMEFYLEALDRDIRKPHENPSVGIILCKSKDEDVVEYALSRNMSSTMISEYRTKLISKEILQKKLEELYDAADESQNSQQC